MSIIANVVVVGLALVPTSVNAWRDPGSEAPITFLAGAIAGLLSAVSIAGLLSAVSSRPT